MEAALLPSPLHVAAAACCCPTCGHQGGLFWGGCCLQGNPTPTPAPPPAPGWSHSPRARGPASTGTVCQDSGSGWDAQPCCSTVVARGSAGCWVLALLPSSAPRGQGPLQRLPAAACTESDWAGVGGEWGGEEEEVSIGTTGSRPAHGCHCGC